MLIAKNLLTREASYKVFGTQRSSSVAVIGRYFVTSRDDTSKRQLKPRAAWCSCQISPAENLVFRKDCCAVVFPVA
jgi:hypothetical protein